MKATKRVSIKDVIADADRPMPWNINNDTTYYAPKERQREQRPTTTAVEYKPYYEKLRDPRWQKKRLAVMERDNFTCTSCGVNDKTLNVHHVVPYRKNHDPWDYENDELTTLCNDCHEELSKIIYSCQCIVMGRCWCVDSAGEMMKIMYELDALDPYELRIAWQILQLGISRKAFKVEL